MRDRPLVVGGLWVACGGVPRAWSDCSKPGALGEVVMWLPRSCGGGQMYRKRSLATWVKVW